MWESLHPLVRRHSRTSYEAGEYANSVLNALREIESFLRSYYRSVTNIEVLHAPDLCRKALSFQYKDGHVVKPPLIQLVRDLDEQYQRDIQEGYMHIFAGAMVAFRNSKSHENLYPDRLRTDHMLYLVSLIAYKLEESGALYPWKNDENSH